jgi:hypothetical protein
LVQLHVDFIQAALANLLVPFVVRRGAQIRPHLEVNRLRWRLVIECVNLLSLSQLALWQWPTGSLASGPYLPGRRPAPTRPNTDS